MEDQKSAPEIAASPVAGGDDEGFEDGLDSRSVDLVSGESEPSSNRDAKFLLYWMTTTSITTETSFTATRSTKISTFTKSQSPSSTSLSYHQSDTG